MNSNYDYLVELGREYLAHYGVLGMKWGRRKAKDYVQGHNYLEKIAKKKGTDSKKYKKMKGIFDKKYDKDSVYRKISKKQIQRISENIRKDKITKNVARGAAAYKLGKSVIGSSYMYNPLSIANHMVKNRHGSIKKAGIVTALPVIRNYLIARGAGRVVKNLHKDYVDTNKYIKEINKQEKERRKKIKK